MNGSQKKPFLFFPPPFSSVLFQRTLMTMAVVATTGCSHLEWVAGAQKPFEQPAFRQADTFAHQARGGALVETATSRIAGTRVLIEDNKALPPVFSQAVSTSVVSPRTLHELVQDLNALLPIVIRVDESPRAFTGEGAGAVSASSNPGGLGELEALFSELNRGSMTTGSVRQQFQYRGTLQGLLDAVSTRFDVSWRYVPETQSVSFYRFDNRHFSLVLPMLTTSGAGGAAGGGGSGDLGMLTTLQVDLWQSVMHAIENILSGGGEAASSTGGGAAAPAAGVTLKLEAQGRFGRAVATPHLGVVAVTARPEVMTRIAQHIDNINKRFARNVFLDMTVYTVDVSRVGGASLALSMVTQQLQSAVGLAGSSAPTGDGLASGVLTLQGASAGQFHETVVGALSQIGKTHVSAKGSVMAVNGQQAAFREISERPFVASVTNNVIPNVGTQITRQIEKETVGIMGSFLPLITDNNRIFLQYQLELSEVSGYLSLGSGDSHQMVPNVRRRQLPQQQVFVRDGEALLLFSFAQEDSGDTEGLGLGSLAKQFRQSQLMTVILLRASTGGRHAL
jgi:hypothetical protein